MNGIKDAVLVLAIFFVWLYQVNQVKCKTKFSSSSHS